MPTSEVIAAAFPHTFLEKINGTPICIDIDNEQEKQTENAASLPSTRGGGAHGHAEMVVPSARYVVEFSPTSYVSCWGYDHLCMSMRSASPCGSS